MISVAICIPTFRRRRELGRLLNSLSGLRFKKQPEPHIEIFVVDNDPHYPSDGVAREWAHRIKWSLHYHDEQQRGIAPVRNKLASLAKNFDFIAFIDDDEVASPQWLDELLEVQSYYQAEVVTGPVLARYEKNPPKWIINGRFHSSDRYPTGTLRPSMFCTNNLLMKVSALVRFEKPFEERLALIGGEDTLLSMKFHQMGIDAVWADDAVVHEYIPEYRTKAKWLFLRQYRRGNSTIIIDNCLGKRRMAVIYIWKAAWIVTVGLAKSLTSLWTGPEAAVKGISYIYAAAGIIAGLLGTKHEEYARVDYMSASEKR